MLFWYYTLSFLFAKSAIRIVRRTADSGQSAVGVARDLRFYYLYCFYVNYRYRTLNLRDNARFYIEYPISRGIRTQLTPIVGTVRRGAPPAI